MGTKEINDGVKSAFEYDQLVIELLDTPEVQRMEHVKQTGLGYKTFPSLSYARKAHLIGISRVATETFRALERNGSNLPESFLGVLQAIAITHDIGHGPFSHGLERVILGTGGEPHEDISAKMVLGQLTFVDYFSQRPHLLGDGPIVKKVLQRYEQLEKIPEILTKYGVDPVLVAAALSPKVAGQELSPQNRFLKNLIDGSLWDIDKADYLPRDSRAANVDGGYVEPDRMLTDLRVVEQNGERRLALADSALDTLARWVAARKYMHYNVYKHKTTLKFEAMLCEAVKRSMRYFRENDIEIHLLTDSKLLELLTQYDPISAQLALDVSFGRPFKYAMAYTLQSHRMRTMLTGTNDDEETINFTVLQNYAAAQQAQNVPFPEDVIRDEIAARSGVPNHEVLVMFPVKTRTNDEYRKKMDLLVYAKQGGGVTNVTPLIDLLDGTAPFYDRRAQDVYAELCKPEARYFFVVFSPPEHRDTVNKATREFMQSLRRAA
ncbi:MAG: HD domain-containing protein [Candidatus Woesearchaeota archaeon]|nr:HD domain-containing protein [Candidatus Woesearchaeota archaeon]